MPKYLYDVKQRSAEWFALHLGRVTSSCADEIITAGGKDHDEPKPSKQAEKLLYRLLAEWRTGERADTDISTPWMDRGREEEAASIEAFEFQTGLKTHPIGFVIGGNPNLGCSPDRLIGDNGLLELKNPAPATQMKYLLTGQVGEEYFVQVQFQLYVTQREMAYLSSFHPLLDPVILKVPRNETYIAQMHLMMECFVERMLEARIFFEQKFGPAVRPEPKQTASPLGDFDVTEADIDEWLAKR